MSNVVSLGLRLCEVCHEVPTGGHVCAACEEWLGEWFHAVLAGDEILAELHAAFGEYLDNLAVDYRSDRAKHTGRDPCPMLLPAEF